MICKNCGAENKEDARFCVMCGAPLEKEAASAGPGGEDASAQNFQVSEQTQIAVRGKFDWRALLTMENIERFAPLAAFFPFIMFAVRFALGIVLRIVFTIIRIHSLYRAVNGLVNLLLFLVFCLGSIAASAGLFYIAVKGKNKESVWTWIAPGATAMAALACLGQAFHWGGFSFVLGLVSVVLGFDFLARITIANGAMDAPIDPAKDIALYKECYQKYKREHPTEPKAPKTDVALPGGSYFDGSGLELLGLTLLTVLVSAVTCGIGAPWMICMLYSWRIGHTVVNGRRLKFDGSGASLLGHWILWELLSIVTCGIYAFFATVALKKWELSHTYIDGEPIVPGGTNSYFDGNSFEFFGYGLLGGLLITITCTVGFPWVMCMIQNWQTKHMVVNGRRLKFSGTGLGFLGEYIIIALLTMVTCGIYQPWGTVRMQKYIVGHTDFDV